MAYIATFNRNQMMMCSWDSFVEPESIARLIDAFVNSLELVKYGIKEAAREGRPGYDPKGMYKLYLYGSRKGVRSSRKLAESCKINLEVKWLMGGLEPDFRTISDFRKDHIDSLKKIFYEFNERISDDVNWGFSSVDGSKFLAYNSKDNNFTRNKLDDRIKRLNAHTDEYLRILREMDEQEEQAEMPEKLTREVIEKKLKEARERLIQYEAYQKLMEDTGATQLSLTDADARLMKNKNGFAVSYNPQTAVDSKTHLIRDFKMTNQVTDHGMLMPTMERLRNTQKEGILEVVADKGYEKEEDIIKCLENGIIAHVIPPEGKDGYHLEISYEEAETQPASTNPEEIKKCLHAGVIPEAYKEVITAMRVEEVCRTLKKEDSGRILPKNIYGTAEEMQKRAKEGYFVRDPERNLVYCPEGEVLRQKAVKKSGSIRYANKNACKYCKNKNKCYTGKGKWKEIDFTKDSLEKPCRGWLTAEETKYNHVKQKSNVKSEKVKVVKLFLKPNPEKTSQRKCLSEHPFGTIKRAMGAAYFLLKGKRKVAGEFALFCLGYNIERAKNLLGFEKMMKIMAGA